jgi:hypothetical protein
VHYCNKIPKTINFKGGKDLLGSQVHDLLALLLEAAYLAGSTWWSKCHLSEIQKSEKRKRKKLESHNPFEAHPQ